MPKGNRFVKLYIEHLHYANCHAGPRAPVGLLRQTIWLINAWRECIAVVRRCTHCFRYKRRLMSQIMGNLPLDRVRISRPFRISGVDLFGPIRVSLGIFNSLVHDDESLSNVEKFNHLLSCLEKEALGTVKATRKILANAMIIHIVMSRVDLKTRSRWEEQLSYDSIPLWKVCSEALN